MANFSSYVTSITQNFNTETKTFTPKSLFDICVVNCFESILFIENGFPKLLFNELELPKTIQRELLKKKGNVESIL